MNDGDPRHDGTTQPEILINEEIPHDPTVVVAEPDRTVVLTEEETIVIDKPLHVEIVPNNRPRKVYGGMWGPAELGAMAAAMLALVGVIAFYLMWVSPAASQLERTRAERDQLEKELTDAKSKYGGITDTQTQVEKLVDSVNTFETVYLPMGTTGRTELYQRLNMLIASFGLVNTNGPNYAPLDLNEEQTGGDESEKKGRAKFKSIFPGVYVTMTLEGSYENLRRFIEEIETSRDFTIISSVELEPTESKQKEQTPDGEQPQQVIQQPVQGFPGMGNPRMAGPMNPTRGPVMPQQSFQPARPQGKTHGERVSLRLEMAAYFRREMPPAAPTVTQQ